MGEVTGLKNTMNLCLFCYLVIIIYCAGIFAGCDKKESKPEAKVNSIAVGIYGADAARSQEIHGNDKCYVFERYIVKTSEALEDVEDIIDVRLRLNASDIDCNRDFSQDAAAFHTRGTFMGLYKDYIILDHGTGPDGRAITIDDLSRKKAGYSASYSNPTMRVENNILKFFKDVEPEQEIDCPEAEEWRTESGLSVGYEQLTYLDLDTFREVPAGEIKCAARQ